MPETKPPVTSPVDERPVDEQWYLSDCEGRLEIWRVGALKHVTRDEDGEITGYQTPGHYTSTDLIAEWDLNTWDPGQDVDDDTRRAVAARMVADHNTRVDAAAELERLRKTNADLDEGITEVIRERDAREELLDQFAGLVAPVAVIGEHSSGNDPWANAMDLVTPAEDVEQLRAELATVQAERHDLAANLEAFYTADPEQRGLAALLQAKRAQCEAAEDGWEKTEAELEEARAALAQAREEAQGEARVEIAAAQDAAAAAEAERARLQDELNVTAALADTYMVAAWQYRLVVERTRAVHQPQGERCGGCGQTTPCRTSRLLDVLDPDVVRRVDADVALLHGRYGEDRRQYMDLLRPPVLRAVLDDVLARHWRLAQSGGEQTLHVDYATSMEHAGVLTEALREAGLPLHNENPQPARSGAGTAGDGRD